MNYNVVVVSLAFSLILKAELSKKRPKKRWYTLQLYKNRLLNTRFLSDWMFEGSHIHTHIHIHTYVTSPPRADPNFLTHFTAKGGPSIFEWSILLSM